MTVADNDPPVNGTPATTHRHRVAIVGAGFAGLFAAKALAPRAMTEVGLAVFVVVGFLLPVPVLAWLDRPVNRPQGR